MSAGIFIYLQSGKNNTGLSEPDLASQQTGDTLNQETGYDYSNKDLGFALHLPASFEYFQTQRNNKPKYTEIEIYVPTSDMSFPQPVPGYARAFAVKVYDKQGWNETNGKDENDNLLIKLIEDESKVVSAVFWDNIPNDWAEKWSEEVKDQIIKSFKKID